MHRHFIIKPNPYITNKQAENAQTHLAIAQVATGLSVISLGLSIFKVVPQISLNSAFKRYTVFQFLISAALFGYYCYEINNLQKLVP
jgi:low temperature requirement protein LtrA